jgi:tRNA threonylcarbamoyladenosine biosynthesis protein TsaB
MNLLAFDTSTELMSVAVQRGVVSAGDTAEASPVWQHSGPGGAQTSASLIPTIERLLAQAALQFSDLDAIVFGQGPGSFTGLRTACSVAQGLALGANLKVLPIDTLLALAEEARFQQAATLPHWQVMALLDARMDEMYAAGYAYLHGQWRQIQDHGLLRPEDLACDAEWVLAGNVFAAYGARLVAPALPRIDAWPTATALLRLAPSLLAAGGAVTAEQALPLYIRDKVAKTTVERAAEKALG